MNGRAAMAAAGLAVVFAGCAATGATVDGTVDTVESVCADVEALAGRVVDSPDVLDRRWVDDVDELGVRAAGLGTPRGDRLMDGLAMLSVAIQEQDPAFGVAGLDKVLGVCT